MAICAEYNYVNNDVHNREENKDAGFACLDPDICIVRRS